MEKIKVLVTAHARAKKEPTGCRLVTQADLHP
jgi:hypothetical protein